MAISIKNKKEGVISPAGDGGDNEIYSASFL